MIITDLRDDYLKIEESEVVEILKSIYEGYPKYGAVYHAASLCVTYPTDSHPRGEKEFLLTFNVMRHMSEEINYWVAKTYVKNKTEKHSSWDDAQIIIKNYEEKHK